MRFGETVDGRDGQATGPRRFRHNLPIRQGQLRSGGGFVLGTVHAPCTYLSAEGAR